LFRIFDALIGMQKIIADLAAESRAGFGGVFSRLFGTAPLLFDPR
jgi:hypothetical protein